MRTNPHWTSLQTAQETMPAFCFADPVESVDKMFPFQLPREWLVRRVLDMPRGALGRLACPLELAYPVAECRDAVLQCRAPPTLMPRFGAKRSSIILDRQMALRRAGISTGFCTKLWKNGLRRVDASKNKGASNTKAPFWQDRQAYNIPVQREILICAMSI
jgi:hypothetical protein